MKIELNEFIGAPVKVDLKESFNSAQSFSNDSIMQDIEGIHAGPTRNFTWYTEEALKSSIPSWTRPYQKPLIMHHNETDGKIIGRVISAKYKENNTRSGTPAIVFTCNIPDEEGIKQILDGRLKTTSIGVTALEASCSICGQPLEIDPQTGESTCRHIRGHVYNGKVCYWMVTRMEAKELSYVIVPSDKFAHNLKTYYPDGKIINIQENLKKNNLDLKEGEINKMGGTNVKESTIINEVNGQAVNDDPTLVTDPVQEPKEPIQEPVQDPAQEPAQKDDETNKEDVESLKSEIAKLKETLETQSAAAKEAKLLLTKAQAEIDKLTKEVTDEKELREASETQLLETKQEFRESLENNVNTLREMLNKEPLSKEVLAVRATNSLKDSLLDLKEEFKGISKHIDLKEANDPTLKNQLDNFEKNNEPDCVNENKVNSNINMTESEENKDVFDFLKNFAK